MARWCLNICRKLDTLIKNLKSVFSKRKLDKSERELKLEFAKLLLTLSAIFTIISDRLSEDAVKSFYLLIGLFLLSGIFYVGILMFSEYTPPAFISLVFAITFSALLSILLAVTKSHYYIIYLLIGLITFLILHGKPKKI